MYNKVYLLGIVLSAALIAVATIFNMSGLRSAGLFLMAGAHIYHVLRRPLEDHKDFCNETRKGLGIYIGGLFSVAFAAFGLAMLISWLG